MELLIKCMHVNDYFELGKREVDLKTFIYVTYDTREGHERKNIYLVTSQVSNEYLNCIFYFKFHFFFC
jgi:hypothetical protein